MHSSETNTPAFVPILPTFSSNISLLTAPLQDGAGLEKEAEKSESSTNTTPCMPQIEPWFEDQYGYINDSSMSGYVYHDSLEERLLNDNAINEESALLGGYHHGSYETARPRFHEFFSVSRIGLPAIGNIISTGFFSLPAVGLAVVLNLLDAVICLI